MDDTLYFETRVARADIWMGFGGSLLVHLLIVFSFVLLPLLTPKQAVSIPFYQVKLVAPEEIGLEPPALNKPVAVRKRPASRTTTTESLPVMPVKRLRYRRPTTRVGIAKTTQDVLVPTVATPSPKIDQDLEEILPKPRQETPPEPVLVQNQAADDEMRALDTLTNPADLPEPVAPSPVSPTDVQDDEEIGLAQRLYYTEVWNAIKRQWALPSMLRSSHLEAVIILVVRRDGRILDTSFEKRSGNDAFDESALRAVRKANPLPPFPEIYSPGKVEIGVRFRPRT